jgi:soluble lytic murein transglycosylase-like protein
MVTPTRWGCRGARLLPPLLLASLLSACHHAPPPPKLAAALSFQGPAPGRAAALVEVGVGGAPAERARAWYLAGLLACDAGASLPASAYFARGGASGGSAALAARRLEDALGQKPLGPDSLNAVLAAPYLSSQDTVRLRLRCAEALLDHHLPVAAAAVLPVGDDLRPEEVRRALALAVRAGQGDRAALERRVLLEAPQDFGKLFPAESRTSVTRGFATTDWAEQAQAWLDGGDSAQAIRAGQRGGAAGALVAARACLKLRRSAEALGLAASAGSSLAVWIERGEAYRQMAWGSSPPNRLARFADMLRATREASRLLTPGAPESGRVAVQEAEALTELGHLEQAAAALGKPGCAQQPRFDWVLRRWFLLSSGGKVALDAAPKGVGGTRVRRIAELWRGMLAARSGDRSALEGLSGSGLPDLPAIWASEALGRPLPTVTLSAAPPSLAGPPPWARDLLTLGRTADIAVAWRADLESGRAPAQGWLGLAALVKLPPLETIPLLVRGEPRLLAGSWEGLSVALLEQYLPLLWRQEIEQASRRAGIPPWVLAGVVRQESAWNPHARSPASALGLSQILLDTGREASTRAGVRIATEADLFDPGKNLAVGAVLLASLHHAFGAWSPALASYNAGERRVREVWDRTGKREGPEFVESIELPETWDYVHRVVFLAEGYRIVYWPEGRPFPWT